MDVKDKTMNKRQFLLLAGILAVLIAAGGYLYYRHQTNTIREQKHAELTAIAKLKINQLVQWRKERMADARTISSETFFIREVDQWLHNKINRTLKEDIKKFLVVLHKESDYESIFLVSIGSEILLSEGSTLHRFDLVASEKVVKAAKFDSVTFSDFYYCKLENTIHFDISVPLKNEKNITIAVLVLRINPYDYIYPFIQSWPTPSKTSETVIFRKEGDSVLFLSELRFRAGASLSYRIPLTQKEIPAVQSVLGIEGLYEGKDYRGVEVLADIHPVPGTAWFMEAKVDRDEMYSVLYDHAIVVFAFTGILMLVCGIGVMWIYHYRQRNIYRTLWQTQEEYRTTLYSIGDAVITADKRGRVQYLNVVAEQLTGWKERDAKNKPNEEVFHIINENTRARIENPVQLVIKEGHIVGLANHTLLISKDGREIPIADSGSSIRDDKNEIIGVVLVFRDQTEERASQKLLRDSENRYRRLFEAARDGILILDADTGVIVDVNLFLIEMLGFSHEEFCGKTLWELGFFKDIVSNKENFLELQEKGYIRYEDLPLETTDGRKIEVEFVSHVYLVDHHKVIQCNIRDITERKRAEAALATVQRRYRELFDNVAIGLLRSTPGPEGAFIDVNPAMVKIFEADNREQLMTLQLSEIYWDSSQRRIVSDVLMSKGFIEDEEIKFKTLKGRPIWCCITGIKKTDTNGQVYFDNTIEDITKRKQAEEELKKSEEKYRSIFENVQDVYYETLFDGTVLEVSPSIKFISKGQYKRADLIGRSMYEFYADTKNRDAIISAIQKTSSVSDFEVQLKNRDGSIIVCSISAKINLDAQGRPEKIIGSMHDITERKKAEEALRETTDYLENLLSFANAPILVWDNKLRITKFNLTFERMTGYTMHDVMSKHPEVLFPAELRSDLSTYISRTSEGENLLSIEMPILCKDGSIHFVIWNTANIYTTDSKSITATIAIGQDITERRWAEEELKKSEGKFRAIFDNASDGMFLVDLEARKFFMCNAMSVNMLGYTQEEFLTLDIDGIHPSEDLPFINDQIRKFSKGEVGIRSDIRFKRKDGSIFVSDLSPALLTIAEKKYLLIIFKDITKRMQMEEGLRQMQKLEGLGTLAGGIAHDFNNILGIILAYITSATRLRDNAKKLDLAVNTIVKAVERGKTLVQQILTFARKTETAFGVVNVNDVVMEIVNMIYEMFPKTVTCSQNFDKSIPYISADRSQLHQVLMNLCVNARDAMPKGGVLSINTLMVSVASLRHQHPDAVGSSYICIEVSDTGEGMTEEIRKHIFEPFFTTKKIGKGTGLGLAVVFGVVQSHKGFIDVESEIGNGTTFRIYLPMSEVAKPIIEKEEKTLEEIQGGTETILVVEDEEMLLMSLQMVLVDKGYKVLSAQDGFKALVIYQERKKDIALVLTDLGLPNISGLEVCQHIKAINPNERIILATGFLDPDMKSEFLKAGIQHFLYKPYDLKEVLKVVREVLDEK